MADDRNWFTSMFVSEPQEGDIVTSRTLNITKITALLAPTLTAAVGAVSTVLPEELAPLRDLDAGQRLTLVVVVFLFVAAVVLVDMLVRGYVTGKVVSADAVRAVTTISPGLNVQVPGLTGHSAPGCAVAVRTAGSTEFLVATTDHTAAVVETRWVAAADVRFVEKEAPGGHAS